MRTHDEEIILVERWAQSHRKEPAGRDFITQAIERSDQRIERRMQGGDEFPPDDIPSPKDIYEFAKKLERELTLGPD